MSGSTAPTPATTTRHVAHVMNLPISLALRGRHAHDETGRRAWDRVMEELREVDRVFSTYRPDSVISRLSREEVSILDCPPSVSEVIELGERAGRESGGAFTIWPDAGNGSRRLDPTGVVKGWAIEQAATHLRALPGTDFCLSGGGDMVCRTLDPAAPPWRIGIEDPFDPQRIRAVVPIVNGAVATSGRAHRGTHILDGRTNAVPTRMASVTVIADSLTWADIDATATYALDGDGAEWLRQRPGRSGLVVWADGRHEIISAARVDASA